MYISYSPMCETLSKADRMRTRHFTRSGQPHSDLAKRHMRCLRRVMSTLRYTYSDPRRTMITIENPHARFKDLDLVRAIQCRPGWSLHTADHCSMRTEIDTQLFPKKPTSWLTFGHMPDLRFINLLEDPRGEFIDDHRRSRRDRTGLQLAERWAAAQGS